MQQAVCAHSATVTRASLENSSSFSATRRGMLAGLSAIPAVLLAGQPIQPSSPFQRALAINRAAEARFNNLPGEMERASPKAYDLEQDRYIATWDAVFDAEPANWSEFVKKLEFVCEDGDCGLNEDQAARLLADAKRLLSYQALRTI